MLEELRQIDTSYLDALDNLKKEQRVLEGLIEKALTLKDKVSEVVHQRVMQDYEARRRAHEAQAQPLREKARGEFVKLRVLHDRLKETLDKARLDQQEIEFRHEVGELGDEEFGRRREASEQVLSGCQRDFDEADGVRQRFLDVLPPEALEPPKPAPPPPAPPQPPPAPRVAPSPAAEAPASRTAPAPPPPPPPPRPPSEGATVYMVAEEPPEPAPDFGTVVVETARLLVETEGGFGQTHILAAITTIGRTPDNEIQVETPEVSRKHARISLSSDGGYKVVDLNSGNGTYVNGERVAEHSLKDGDRIQVGNTYFVFKTG